jgi:hypothetical protein
MHRTGSLVFAELAQALGEEGSRLRFLGHQARSSDRRERYRDLELRIVAPSGTRKGVGPAMIEYVLAIAMSLAIARHCALHRLFFEDEMLRKPAGVAHG